MVPRVFLDQTSGDYGWGCGSDNHTVCRRIAIDPAMRYCEHGL